MSVKRSVKRRWSRYLQHYGTPRHSGRYPWGSGKNPYQSLNRSFINRDREYRKQGMTEKERAKAHDMTVTEYRARYSAATNAVKKEDILRVQKLHDKGLSNMAISRETGFPESTIRNYLKPTFQARRDTALNISEELKKQLNDHPYLDIGRGVETQLGCSKTQLQTAVEILKQQGYGYHRIGTRQTTDVTKELNVIVLTKPGVSFDEVRANKEKISSPQGIKFEDYAEKVRHFEKPKSISSKRVQIRWPEEGGDVKDGVIEIREGVKDLEIGSGRYAQVRIAVDGTHYIKGMAMYSDGHDMPPGVDIIFNTSKDHSTYKMINKEDKDHSVLKPMKTKTDANGNKVIDEENPFGASVKDQRGALNLVNEEEDWEKWSKTLASQFLSKQYPIMAKRQLDKTHLEHLEEFNDICALTNPTIKRKLLEDFADNMDSASVHLKATAFPRQAAHVILPINSLKDNEIYAPNYRDGEEVILVRYPHEGVFQIPRLIVNNRNKDGKTLLRNAKTAVGINANVAAQLSGADFDGDTVTVIPTNGMKFKTDKWPELQNFNPHEAYPAYEGMQRVGPDTGFHKQDQMGKISNLVTDMTLQGATKDEITRAVRHAMTVIDAEKHNLDWRRSAEDNRIADLKKKYQGGANRGAATLISRASSEEHPPERKKKYVSEMTPEELKRHQNGEVIYKNSDRMISRPVIDKKTGELIGFNKKVATETSTKMREAFINGKDATSLISDANTPIENIYAEYANRTKALANAARKALYSTGRLKLNPSAKKIYAEERASLIAKLNLAKKNAPLERQAQLISNYKARARIEEGGITDKDDQKKIRQQELKRARDSIGTKSRNPNSPNSLSIKITDREWEAIQAGAISDTSLSEIIKYCDMDILRERATPKKQNKGLTAGAKSRARSLLRNGYTQAEVASELGVSVSTLVRELDI